MKLIDADALMEAIEIRMKSKEDDFKAVSELMAINRYIAQVSPVKKQDSEWIPVEERLPENGQVVLVTRQCQNENWYVEQDEYYDDTGFESGVDENIVAWMPLPEPYRP